ncbi:MAG: hypothetical protein ACJ8J0_09425 [Longimicrobiaceae bacterium]
MDVRDPEPAFLIAAACRAVARSSIRDVAVQAGISSSGLHKLLSGNTRSVYGPTISRLRTWYLREWATGTDGLTMETAAYLMQQLLAPIDEGKRRRAGLELLRALEGIYQECDTPRPAWFAPLGNEYRQLGG